MPRTTTPGPARAALSPVLSTIPLDEAHTLFGTLDHDWDLIPSTHRKQFTHDWDTITQTAPHLDITDVRQLLTDLPALLCAITGINSVTTYQTAADAETLHRLRNTVMVVTLAAPPTVAHPAILEHTRGTLRQRTTQTNRPLLDDEITLLRTLTATTEIDTPASKRTAVYALCDAGMLAAETTKAYTNDVVGAPDAPTAILADGNRDTQARFLPLHTFHRAALAQTLDVKNTRGPKTLLTYTPNRNLPGSSAAAASACGLIGRLLRDAGLQHPDTAPASIVRWRIAHTLHLHGDNAAQEISGADAATTRRRAGAPLTEHTPRRRADNFMAA